MKCCLWCCKYRRTLFELVILLSLSRARSNAVQPAIIIKDNLARPSRRLSSRECSLSANVVIETANESALKFCLVCSVLFPSDESARVRAKIEYERIERETTEQAKERRGRTKSKERERERKAHWTSSTCHRCRTTNFAHLRGGTRKSAHESIQPIEPLPTRWVHCKNDTRIFIAQRNASIISREIEVSCRRCCHGD